MDQRTRDSTHAKPYGGKHKVVTPTDAEKVSRNASTEKDRNFEEKSKSGNPSKPSAIMQERHGQANAASLSGFAAESNPVPCSRKAQQENSGDAYQAAYAQAYADFQAQFQAAYPSSSNQQLFRSCLHTPACSVQSAYLSPPPPVPVMPAPFPNAPRTSASTSSSSAQSNDGLANVLLAWYQSGYYTGRFQAIQEMKMHSHP